MRLKFVFISNYKNLKDFSLSFDGDSFIDIFVGKNGSGKSNFFEALIEIFRHIYEYDKEKAELSFNYSIKYDINGIETEITWNAGQFNINGRIRATIGMTLLPDNLLIYYSGHNDTVTDLVGRYEKSFRDRIISANLEESRRFLGIGPEYKKLLLAVLLIQKDENKARKFICHKLGIQKLGIQKPGSVELTEPVVRIVLERPFYAKNSDFDIVNNDASDQYWKPKGIAKTFLERLTKCVIHTPGGMTLSEGFFPYDQLYILYFDIARIQQEFADLSTQDLFRQFDNLKTLGMLKDISIPIKLSNGSDATITHFSDGQFQSVYIYSIIELFKNKNCLTLLDEPDAFLHPEWQFDFLNQVLDITNTTSKNNHVLMSSHSASTITMADERFINLFNLKDDKIVITKVAKGDVIKFLSAGRISFSESEARLNINHILQNTSGPVLFTEGITDEMILETAWSKLYPSQVRKFEIQMAFCRNILYTMFSRDELSANFPNRILFALFDFDEAYDDWNGLWNSTKGKQFSNISIDPYTCLCKKHNDRANYALLLPVPRIGPIEKQVLKSDGTPWGKGTESHLSIELLFYKDALLGKWFSKRSASGGGELIEFRGDKVKFANEFIPNLDSTEFEVLRPLFDLIKGKI